MCLSCLSFFFGRVFSLTVTEQQRSIGDRERGRERAENIKRYQKQRRIKGIQRFRGCVVAVLLNVVLDGIGEDQMPQRTSNIAVFRTERFRKGEERCFGESISWSYAFQGMWWQALLPRPQHRDDIAWPSKSVKAPTLQCAEMQNCAAEVQNAICRAEEVKDMQRVTGRGSITLHMCIPILMQYDAVTKIPQISLRCDESFNFFRFTAGFFCQFVPNESAGAQAMKARRLFKSLDDDETGQISFKEILNHTKDCGFPESL